MRHCIPISGKDSFWTAVVQKRRQPDLPYEYIYNDVGADLPEVNGWLAQAEVYLGAPIKRLGKNLIDEIYEVGILPSAQARYCTRKAKIYPTEDYFGREPTLLYLGLRADEQRMGYRSSSPKLDIRPVYPLVEEKQGLREVWEGVSAAGMLPPSFFWPELHQRVVAKLGPDASQLETLAPWTFNALFAWRTRMNCFMCFYQRRYELVGLWKHHPDLFQQAVELEEDVGGQGFYLLKDFPLREVPQRADGILDRRANVIAKAVRSRAMTLEQDEDAPDPLDVVSCGFLCGK